MGKRALVIGATGLLGYGVTLELQKNNWDVRAVGHNSIKPTLPESVEYVTGDFYNMKFLQNCLNNVDKVFYFLATTFPSSSMDSLENEINITLKSLDYLVQNMLLSGVHDLVYPSSGGTVYGNISYSNAKEIDVLNPVTPYGLGKKMCEEMLHFYASHGINSIILRIGNVYGTSLKRIKTQGVIDVFVERALKNEKIIIWGKDALENTRDYIFTDDFSTAVVKVAEKQTNNFEIYNIGSGKAISLIDIIRIIQHYIPNSLEMEIVNNKTTSAIKRVVLDNTKIKEYTGWVPQYTIEKGIFETIRRKKLME